MKKTFQLLFLLVTVVSCIAPKYVTNITNYGTLENTSKKTATVVGLDRVFIHEYEKTFHKNFSSTLEFSQSLTEDFANALKVNSFVHQAKVDVSEDWEHINTMSSKKSYLTVQTLFDACTTDYLVCLDEFKIKRKVEVSTSLDPTGVQTNSNGSKEYVVILANVKIYDVKSHEPIIEYDVMGEDQVIFFSYTDSMMDAREKLVLNSLAFLKNHKE